MIGRGHPAAATRHPLCRTLLLLGAGLLVACAGDHPAPGSPATPPPAVGGSPTATGSGIAGEVVLGPLCPAVPQGSPCPDHPYTATLRVQEWDGRRDLLMVQSGDDGQFRVDVPPGEYRLVPVSPQPGAPPYAEPQLVTVQPGQYTQVIIRYDTGIR